MHNARRLTVALAGMLVAATFAAQLVSAAAGAKIGTTYTTSGSQQIDGNLTVIASMTMPAGAYHLTAQLQVENNDPNLANPGALIPALECAFFAGGNGYWVKQTIPAGGFVEFTMENTATGFRLPSVYTEVACKAQGSTAPYPYVFVTINADVVGSVVSL
jgi:hypothetical protein